MQRRCSIEDCKKKRFARGWCQMHYERWRQHGDPSVRLQADDGSWSLCRGYRMRKIDGKTVYEHREVAEKKLGRPLRPSEDVHHINGNKIDNRPENLVVLTKSAHSKLHNPPQSSCMRGHPATSENMWQGRNGKRVCRACRRERYAMSKNV